MITETGDDLENQIELEGLAAAELHCSLAAPDDELAVETVRLLRSDAPTTEWIARAFDVAVKLRASSQVGLAFVIEQRARKHDRTHITCACPNDGSMYRVIISFAGDPPEAHKTVLRECAHRSGRHNKLLDLARQRQYPDGWAFARLRDVDAHAADQLDVMECTETSTFFLVLSALARYFQHLDQDSSDRDQRKEVARLLLDTAAVIPHSGRAETGDWFGQVAARLAVFSEKLATIA